MVMPSRLSAVCSLWSHSAEEYRVLWIFTPFIQLTSGILYNRLWESDYSERKGTVSYCLYFLQPQCSVNHFLRKDFQHFFFCTIPWNVSGLSPTQLKISVKIFKRVYLSLQSLTVEVHSAILFLNLNFRNFKLLI